MTVSFALLQEPDFMLYAEKFMALQSIHLFILPSWNNVLAIANLLKATPDLKRLRLEVCPKCSPFCCSLHNFFIRMQMFFHRYTKINYLFSPLFAKVLAYKVRINETTSSNILVITDQMY